MKQPILLGCALCYTSIALATPINLEQAQELALKTSPQLKAAHIQTQSAKQSVEASGIWKNPNLELEAEGLGFEDDLFSHGEYTVGLSQELKRKGQSQQERAVATTSIAIAAQQEQAERTQFINELQQAFLSVMTQQEIETVRTEQLKLGVTFLKETKKRFKAGGASELDIVRAELSLDELILAQTCCFGDLLAAQEILASYIGTPTPKELIVEMESFYTLPDLSNDFKADAHPALQQLSAQAQQIRSQADQDRASDRGNIKLGAGYKYEVAEEQSSFLLSAKVPLRLHKSGKAQQAVGYLKAEALQAKRDALKRSLSATWAAQIAQYDGAKTEVKFIREKLIPHAQKAYDLTKEGYLAGQYSSFELIAAQQHLADLRIRYIEALQDAHLIRINILNFTSEGI